MRDDVVAHVFADALTVQDRPNQLSMRIFDGFGPILITNRPRPAHAVLRISRESRLQIHAGKSSIFSVGGLIYRLPDASDWVVLGSFVDLESTASRCFRLLIDGLCSPAEP